MSGRVHVDVHVDAEDVRKQVMKHNIKENRTAWSAAEESLPAASKLKDMLRGRMTGERNSDIMGQCYWM